MFTSSVGRIQLTVWVWFTIIVQIAALSQTFSNLGPQPRAALVSFAHEFDLPDTLTSIRQLEETFNDRYRYDWIVFSTDYLSDHFKALVSNATKAQVFFEIIANSKWNIPHWRQPADTSRARVHCTSCAPSFPDNRPINRWKLGPFASESRLKNYDWFWRIESGVRSPNGRKTITQDEADGVCRLLLSVPFSLMFFVLCN